MSQIRRSMQISSIAHFFHGTREPGFCSTGETQSMPMLLYVEQGTLHSVTEGRDLLLRPGELAFIGQGQWHIHYADPAAAPRYAALSFDLSGLDPAPLLNRKIAADPRTAPLLSGILRQQDSADSADLMITLLSLLLLVLLGQSEGAAEPPDPENVFICRAQQYVSCQLRQKLTVPLVAQHTGISPSYLTALFRKHLGIAPAEYIRRLKLQESKALIRENRLNFTGIADALHYSTVHHFSRQFKEHFGITPSEYARSAR